MPVHIHSEKWTDLLYFWYLGFGSFSELLGIKKSTVFKSFDFDLHLYEAAQVGVGHESQATFKI